MKKNQKTSFSNEILKTVLEYDETPYGGISYPGETVFDFLLEIGEDEINTIKKLNEALIENGIKPIPRTLPVLFNSEMVRAIISGKKSQTRRLIKPQPLFPNDIIYHHENGKWYISPDNDNIGESEVKTAYNIGDILYVRETWAKASDWTDVDPSVGISDEYLYKADWKDGEEAPKWKPSIHMPKEAARIFLRVKNIRAERLQSISYDDIDKEGCYPHYTQIACGDTPPVRFAKLWDSTINPSDLYRYGWKANPYVWVYEFGVIRKEEK